MKSEVQAWMRTELLTLTEEASMMDAINLTRKHNIRHIPIVRNGGTLVGLVSDRDIKKFSPSILNAKGPGEFQEVLEETPVGTIMTKEPITISPSTPLREAVELFFENKVGALPVIAGGKLVGILTDNDMLRAFHQGLVGAEKKRKLKK